MEERATKKRRTMDANMFSAHGDRQSPRGLTYTVLRLVSILGKRAYGVEIRDRLSQQLRSDVPAAQVYVMLRRLEDYGFVVATDQNVTKSAGRKGRPRRVYEITAPGQRALTVGAKLYEYPVLHLEPENVIQKASSAKVG
jgi:DNA-binding PadR family transcriptional regulator